MDQAFATHENRPNTRCVASRASLYEVLWNAVTIPKSSEIADGATPDVVVQALPLRTVAPSSATHAILTLLKAGETVHQAGELPKTLRVSEIHYE